MDDPRYGQPPMPGMGALMPVQNYGLPESMQEHDQRKQSLADILQQIMTITDQSLDEAQARFVK